MTSLFERKAETVRSFQDFAEGQGAPRWPAELFLEISNVCDLKCAMCPTFSALNPNRLMALKHTERGFLETEQVARPLEEVLTHALNVHCFGYGEPTIHPAFRETIEYLSRFEVMIDFFTNGMHLDADLADFLVRSNVFRVTVSFSGATAEEYENVYLGGRFEQVLAGLRHLDEAKRRHGRRYPHIVINSIGFQHHVDRLDEFVELMAAHGVGDIAVKPLLEHAEMIPELAGHAAIVRPGSGAAVVERAKARASELGVALYGIEALSGGHERSAPAVPVTAFKERQRQVQPLRPTAEAPPEPRLPADDPAALARALDMQPAPEPFYCMEPFKTLYVKRSGEVKPCCFGGGPALGSVKETAAEEIWRGDAFSMVRDGILAGLYPMAVCRDCLKYRTAPQHHSIPGLWEGYLYWHGQAYGSAGAPSPQLPGNLDLVRGLEARDPARTARLAVLLGVEAHLDYASRDRLFGWVWTPFKPDHRFEITIRMQGGELARVVADRYRQDLEQAGKGDGRYYWDILLSESLPEDLEPKEIEVFIEGTTVVLRPNRFAQ